jgi:hypothetical protein
MLSLGNLLLALSILLTIAGVAMLFSKKEREQMQKRVMSELPERAAITGSPDALKAAQHRGYITLAVGVALLILWSIFFGLQSLATS